ncbi:hypothetical protein EDD37DRAFT_295367 [Exophiala viscosa]|uniref:Uncharacterized protein n=1 Tax=Exophiala viscosa TaxID=2486360 RepID=A0AAN6IKY6_9EURO|nr:hypothetical protein EDD36DRAFT_460663 [Exophiala viscosa]KAI1628160.1 hypothetical protein EDD37DRAFT_295367 [Exophiala viscosa]
MPTSFRPVDKAPSTTGSLRTEPLLTPPLSHNSSEDIPFRADDADRISLNMKKRKGHRHGWHHSYPRRAPTMPTEGSFKRCRHDCKDQHVHTSTASRLRSTRSLPTMKSRTASARWQSPDRAVQCTRRWSVASKAPSTRGLATVTPVVETANRRRKNRTSDIQSPAMITLRRATIYRSPEQTSLTSFPTPTFSKREHGFLSSFLNSITGQEDYRTQANLTLQHPGYQSRALRSPSLYSNEAWPSTSSIAPPMVTEITSIEPQLTMSQPTQVINSVRRCSTKYISDDGMHEIIWDENSTSASPASVIAETVGEAQMGEQHSNDTGALQRRLSEVLTQSRRGSSSVQLDRRTSYWPGSENLSQALLPLINNSPKLAKMAREAAFRSLPRSKASRQAESVNAPVTPLFLDRQHLLVAEEAAAADGDIQYFPPLAGVENPHTRSASIISDNEAGSPLSGSPGEGEVSVEPRPRSRLGSMVGISRHQKRLSFPADTVSTNKVESRSIAQAGKSRASRKMSGDDKLPLLESR